MLKLRASLMMGLFLLAGTVLMADEMLTPGATGATQTPAPVEAAPEAVAKDAYAPVDATVAAPAEDVPQTVVKDAPPPEDAALAAPAPVDAVLAVPVVHKSLDELYPEKPKFVLHIQSKTRPECYSYIVGDACFEDLQEALASVGFDTSRIVMPGYHDGEIWFMPVKGYDKDDTLTPEQMMWTLRDLGFRSFVPDQAHIRDN